MELFFNICVFILTLSFMPCHCDHFRGGTISWKPTGIKYEVEFKYKLGWRHTYGIGCTPSLIGRYVDVTLFPWVCTSGCAGSGTVLSSKGYTCTAVSTSEDWELGEYTFRYTFSKSGPFTVSYSSCCWINLDYGKGNGTWNLPTTVDLGTRSDLKVPNSSPVAAGKPLYIIKYGCTQTIKLPVLDQDGDNIRCRWASGTECSSACRRIPNAFLDENKCTLTISATTGAGDIYAVAIMVEDRPKTTITLSGRQFTPQNVLSSVPLQFLVKTPDIKSRSCSDRPVFVNPTPAESAVIVVQPGGSLYVSFYATSRGTSIRSFLLIGPPGLRKSSIRQLSLSPGVHSIDVTWTPSASDRGPQSLCAEATDAYQISSDMRCVTIAAWDINPCTSAPCLSNGTCSRIGYTQDFVCDCLPGYTGLQCQTDINECASNPCLNGATCLDLINEYFCGCVPGYTDVNCQTDIDECKIRTCANGGTCHDLVNKAVCDCIPGFTGELCQTGIDLCKSNPCENGAMCLYNATTGYECACSEGWYGSHCAIRHENETYYNDTLMTTDYMHYSSCDCFLGHGKQELCYVYNKQKGIGFGVVGVVLGILTAVLAYSYVECILNKQGPCFHHEDQDDKSQLDADKDTEEKAKMKEAQIESTCNKKEDTITPRHRKCWACVVKNMKDPPPPWLLFKK